MAVVAGLSVDGLSQIQVSDYRSGPEIEGLADDVRQLLVGQDACAIGVDHDGDGLRDADGVGQLDLAAVGKSCGDHVLGRVAGHVAGGAVHLGGILAREGAAAVAGISAVGVDDDLAAGETGVPVGAADDEASGRIDEISGIIVYQR